MSQEVINQVRTILANAIDRDKSDNDTVIMLAHIASNAIYWRNREIEDFKQWLLTETGTTDLTEASNVLHRWWDQSGMFYPYRDGYITFISEQ